MLDEGVKCNNCGHVLEGNRCPECNTEWKLDKEGTTIQLDIKVQNVKHKRKEIKHGFMAK